MINKISDIYDLGFEFSFKWTKDVFIEINYIETIKDIMYDPTTGQVIFKNNFGANITCQSTKPILTFKMDSDDMNFNFVKENLESILNEFIKAFLNWYNFNINDMSEILSNFDDRRILRDIEKNICRLVKLKKLTN